MAGNIGSPLCAELNRIANNGVYPDRDDFLEEQGAANVWAGTTGQGLLGALNYIVDPTRTENNFSDLTKVCNELAGTTGLSDVDALRTINHAAEVLLRGTTPQSAVFSTDAATPRYNYPGFITLNGTSQYISTPDENALDITTDIDIRVRVAMDDWTPSGQQSVFTKWNNSSNSWDFNVTNTFGPFSAGALQFVWVDSGGTSRSAGTNTTVVPFTDGQVGWIRVTLDVDNGASGNDAKFFTSTDGTTWTQLGTTVTQAFTTSIRSGTAEPRIGMRDGDRYVAGKVYQTQVFASINGTDKRLDADLTTNVTSATYDQFTATTGQLFTIFGQNTLTNGGKAGALLPTTVGSSLAADSNDPKFLDHTGTNYVYLPGVASNFLSIPDANDLDITGDIDIRVQVALDDWTPSANNTLISKWNSAATNNRGWIFNVLTSGLLNLQLSADGTAQSAANSTVATGLTDGNAKWVRATYRQSDRRVQFFTSDNGTSWTQLGTDVTSAQASIFSNNANVNIGAFNAGLGGENFTGKHYRAQIYSDITETTKVLDVDTSVITTGAATSFTAVTGQTVTINRSTSGRKTVAVTQPTWLFGTDDYMEVNNRYMAHSTSDENYVYLSGAANNNMTVADNPPLDIAGDIDIQVKVAMDDWTPSAQSWLVGKYVTGTNQRSYALSVNTTGTLVLATSTAGTALTVNAESTVATGITDGATKWVRATMDVDNGASGNTVTFYLSDDGATWTTLGTPVVTAGTTSIFNSTTPLEIGSYNTGISPSKGKFFRAIVKNGIDGTTVLDANAAVITLPSQTTFTDSSSNAYTVTINKSGVGTFVSTGNYLYLPGVNSNQATASDSPALDITGDIDVRAKIAADDWTPAAVSNILAKWQVTGNQRSWRFALNTNGGLFAEWSANGTTVLSHFIGPIGITDGATKWVRWTLDVDNGASGNDSKFFTSDDGLTWTQASTTQTTAGVTSIYNSTAALEIGAVGGQNTLRGDFFRTQILNGIAGTVAFDANFESSITSLTQASFTESSSNAATVTINRSGSAFRSAGVIDAGYLYPGATNTFSNSTTDFLNFGANQSFTLFFVGRQWGTPASFGNYLNKKDNATNQGSGYRFGAYGTGLQTFGSVADGTNVNPDRFAAVYTAGTLINTYGIADRTAQTFMVTQNSNSSATASISTFGAISSPFQFNVGRSSQGTGYQDFELMGVAIFRNTLTPKNIIDINNYFNGRD